MFGGVNTEGDTTRSNESGNKTFMVRRLPFLGLLPAFLKVQKTGGV